MSALVREKARASAMLPGGSVSLADEPSGIGAVVVAWTRASGVPTAEQAQGFGACKVTDGVARGPCVTLPFIGGSQ